MKTITNINYLSNDNLIFLKEKDCVAHEKSLLIKKLHSNLVELDFYKNLNLFSKFKNIRNADKTLDGFLKFTVFYGVYGNPNCYIRYKIKNNKYIILLRSEEEIEYVMRLPMDWIYKDKLQLKEILDKFY